MSQGRSAPVTLNAANEVAVELFLQGRIGFNRIPRVVAEVLERHELSAVESLDDVLEQDRRARELAIDYAKTLQ
jgi:1-deoxy-D-xylulose-5-phosphate reductoisomerase